MRKNCCNFWLILGVILLSGITAELSAQPGETAPMAGDGYVIMKNGDTISGRINWRLKYTENNPNEIKFIPENGAPQILNAKDILGLSVNDESHYVSMPSMKKRIPVFYNRLLDGKLQVYQNRSSVVITKETAEVNTEFDGLEFRYSRKTGLTIGPTYKTSYQIIESRTRYSSYFVSKDQGALQKLDKENYDSVFTALFKDCPDIQRELEKNPDLRKFRNFMILAEVYNQLCR